MLGHQAFQALLPSSFMAQWNAYLLLTLSSNANFSISCYQACSDSICTELGFPGSGLLFSLSCIFYRQMEREQITVLQTAASTGGSIWLVSFHSRGKV